MNQDESLHKLELAISHFLRAGVLVSALFLAIGWFGQLLEPGDLLQQFQTYQPHPLTQTVAEAMAESNLYRLSALLGLAILVSLPILRVLLTAFLFVKQKDVYLAAMAIFVFLVLLSSFFLGIEI